MKILTKKQQKQLIALATANAIIGCKALISADYDPRTFMAHVDKLVDNALNVCVMVGSDEDLEEMKRVIADNIKEGQRGAVRELLKQSESLHQG